MNGTPMSADDHTPSPASQSSHHGCGPMTRDMRLLGVLCALAFITVAGAAPNPPHDFQLPDSIRVYYDSLLRLPDSLLVIPGAPAAMSGSALRTFARHMLYAPESIYAGPDSAHRTDAEMKADFLAHEVDFEQLVGMFQADTGVQVVEVPEWRSPASPARIPASRQQAYDRLLRRTGVRMIVREARGRFLLRTTTVWTFDRRGYAWSPKPPTPLVQDETVGCDDCYRRLKGPWYIFYRASS
jgi:hypothetical protein